MKKILVPCDFSTQSKEAYQFALEIASKSNGEIFIVHALQLPFQVETTFGIQPYPVDPGLINKFEAEALEAFNRLIKSYYRPGNVKVHFRTVHDFVLPAILAFIPDHEIDLVVMGTSGCDGLQEMLIGSNTEKVVRFSPVPVISLKKACGIGKLQNIVLPSNLGLNQTHFMNAVKRLQEFFQAKLHIIHLNTPSHFITDHDGHEFLREYVNHYHLKNYTLNFRSSHTEQEGILEFAREIQANMIAMGTHSRQGLQHLLKGSVAEAVVNHLECPIWTCTFQATLHETIRADY